MRSRILHFSMCSLLCAALSLAGCVDGETSGQSEAKVSPDSTGITQPIEQVLVEQTDSLMALPGVVGTGIGECDDKPCIVVLVVHRSDELLQRIPKMLGGYAVTINETGEFRAEDETIAPGD